MSMSHFKMIVCDEAQKLKNPKAKRTQAAASLAAKIDNTLLLTGTPVLNRPIELIAPLKMMGLIHPTDLRAAASDQFPFGGEKKFKNRYCYDESTNTYNGARNLEELHNKLRRHGFIRRNKRDVLTELPEVQRSVVPVEITNRSEYNLAAKHFEQWLEENDRNLTSAAHLAQITALKQLIAKGKFEATIKWVEDFVNGEGGPKLIVYAYHVEMQQALIEALSKHNKVVSVTAEDIQKGRHFQAIDAFQEDPSVKIIVCSFTAAQTGLTLTAASNVCFVEFGWTPAGHDQAEARCYGRVNDAHGANAYYLAGVDTYDEAILALLDKKRRVVTAITEGREVESGNFLTELLQSILNKEES